MDWLQFWSAIVGSLSGVLAALAWPSAIITIFMIFKKEIREIIPRMKVKHGDTEFSLATAEISTAKTTIPAMVENVDPATTERTDDGGKGDANDQSSPDATSIFDNESFAALIDTNPQYALIVAGKRLESEVIRSASRSDFPKTERRTLISAANYLLDIQKISTDIFKAITELRSIYNKAKHEEDEKFLPSDAWRFKKVSDDIISYLKAFV